MNRSAIDQLRDVNPHPRTLPAPPIHNVLQQLEGRPSLSGGSSRSRPRRAVSFVFPLLAGAFAIGVLVIVLVSVHPGHGRRGGGISTAGHPTQVPPSGSLVAPRHGMRGSIYSFGATALTPSGGGVVSLQQCAGCSANGNHTPNSHVVDWLLWVNGAGSRTLVRTPHLLAYPQLSGQNGWASGVRSNGHGAGGSAEFYVSHDAGRHWSVAPSAASNDGNRQLSLSDGEVWSLGLVGQLAPATVVLHAPVAGSRLVATGAQPTHAMGPNAQVAAAGPHSAYLYTDILSGQMYVTRNDGRGWQHLARPCPTGQAGRLTNVAFGNTVLVVCSRVPPRNAPVLRDAHLTLSRSTDDGRHWTYLPTPFNASYTPILSPVSASVIWALTSEGVLRSADGGTTWQAVWSLAHSQIPGLKGSYPPGTYPGDLIAQGPETATMQLSLVHGRPGSTSAYTNLVRYRTSDGGRTWSPQIVSLTAG